MSAIDRLYSINNKTVKKSINIDDSLYKRLMRYTKKNYDATISDMINVCIEDLLSTGSVKYYAKPEDEITIYRSVMIRKENAEALNKITQETGISLTRLVNIAMKEFLDKYNK
ncbi:MAG: ribbon-helix-helix domain-containing protein [Methanobrevibacter woesei]|nr:ribbon-helix-helix domain-containing protein [Candidatus Alectryobacillus merdavium]MCC9261436.1 ribbon-helix-helix domain-containing protein [Methanobrevibacter woesei]